MTSEESAQISPEHHFHLNDLNKLKPEAATFTVDDAVNKAGYGKFQIVLLFLSGLGWIADSSEMFIITIVSQFLACDWTLTKEQPAILTYAVFVGVAIGGISLGTLGDIFGRKKALAISMILLFVAGFGNAFVPSFWWMVVCRGLIGFGLGGTGQGLTVCTEYCPVHMRGRAAFFLCYFWSFGTIMVILISWVVMQYLNSWRLLLGILSLPSLVGLLSLKALAISMILLFVAGFGNAFVPSFWWMVVCRGLIGFGLGGTGQGLTVCTEYCPVHMRGRAAFFLCYFWSFGTIMVILISWVVMQYLNSWRLLLGILSLPSLVGLLSLKWYPESARYYLVSGQYDSAVEILQRLAKTNGTCLPPGSLVQVVAEEKRGRLKDLLTKEYRVATLLIWYTWWAVALSAYGTVFVSPIIIQKGYLGNDENGNQTNGNQSKIESNIMPCVEFSQQNFIDLLWTSAAEFPGLVLFTFLAELCGRKVLLSASCIVNSFLLLLLLLRTYKIVILLVLFAARGLMLAVFQLLYIVTLEVYPTTFRAVGMGFGNFFSKIAGFIVPYVSQMLVFDHPAIAMGLMAGAIFLAGIGAAFLPFETRGVQMKERAK